MPASEPAISSAEEETPPCPGCGLTMVELAREGRMGCALCYETFVPMVEEAIVELHGVAPRRAVPPAASSGRPALPWPTRRAESARPLPPAPRRPNRP